MTPRSKSSSLKIGRFICNRLTAAADNDNCENHENDDDDDIYSKLFPNNQLKLVNKTLPDVRELSSLNISSSSSSSSSVDFHHLGLPCCSNCNYIISDLEKDDDSGVSEEEEKEKKEKKKKDEDWNKDENERTLVVNGNSELFRFFDAKIENVKRTSSIDSSSSSSSNKEAENDVEEEKERPLPWRRNDDAVILDDRYIREDVCLHHHYHDDDDDDEEEEEENAHNLLLTFPNSSSSSSFRALTLSVADISKCPPSPSHWLNEAASRHSESCGRHNHSTTVEHSSLERRLSGGRGHEKVNNDDQSSFSNQSSDDLLVILNDDAQMTRREQVLQWLMTNNLNEPSSTGHDDMSLSCVNQKQDLRRVDHLNLVNPMMDKR